MVTTHPAERIVILGGKGCQTGDWAQEGHRYGQLANSRNAQDPPAKPAFVERHPIAMSPCRLTVGKTCNNMPIQVTELPEAVTAS